MLDIAWFCINDAQDIFLEIHPDMFDIAGKFDINHVGSAKFKEVEQKQIKNTKILLDSD